MNCRRAVHSSKMIWTGVVFPYQRLTAKIVVQVRDFNAERGGELPAQFICFGAYGLEAPFYRRDLDNSLVHDQRLLFRRSAEISSFRIRLCPRTAYSGEIKNHQDYIIMAESVNSTLLAIIDKNI